MPSAPGPATRAVHETFRRCRSNRRKLVRGAPFNRPKPKFAANISTFYKEAPLIKRYRIAQQVGFRAVECQFPYDISADTLGKAKIDSGMEHVLISSHPGDLTKGELGFAAIPGCEAQFLSSLKTSIRYAKALDCKKIHIMAGITGPERNAAMEETYVSNLTMAAHLLEKEGIVGLIKPLCKEVQPGYFLNSYSQAVGYLEQIEQNAQSKNIRLLLDVFHLQMISGNLQYNISNLLSHAGYVQTAQAPHKNEPGAPGEIDYRCILYHIEKENYTDWIGLEYTPQGVMEDGLYWMSDYGYSL